MVCLLCLNWLLSILGSGLEKDLICLQDPHVNGGEAKTLSGVFDLFAFPHVEVRELIVEGREKGVII